jgi:hypothetical protein
MFELIRPVPGPAASKVLAQLAVAMRRVEVTERGLAFYLTEMEDRGLYRESGHPSAAHFAEAQLGMSRRHAADLIALGRKLLSLPAVDHAFCKEGLTWRQVHLLAEVATPENQQQWIALEVEHARAGGADAAV